MQNATQTLKELLTGLKGYQITSDENIPVTDVAYHSQDVMPGGVFVALKGQRTDGHCFLAAALERGARVTVSEQELPPPPGVTVVRVPDARLALAHLSAAFYRHPSRELQLVGITGTNGKTTTTYLLEAIIGAAGHQPGVVGTINYRLGNKSWPAAVTTPESLDLQRLLREMCRRGASHVFLEVSSHALDLKRVDCAAFTAAVFTNLSQDHLDYHREIDCYFAAKSRLFLDLLAKSNPPGGTAVLNLDDPRGEELHHRVSVPTLTYGSHPRSQIRPLTKRFKRLGVEARLTTPAGEIDIMSRLIGPFNLDNILAATATALALGITLDDIVRGIAALEGIPGRLEHFGPQDGPAVFVDYAHTPGALASVLNALSVLNFSRVVTVFGCGGDRDRGKRPLMGQAAAAASHLVVLTSDNPRSEDPLSIIQEIENGLKAKNLPKITVVAAKQGQSGYLMVPDRHEAIRLAVELAQPGDAVLVAGKGHENYQILGGI